MSCLDCPRSDQCGTCGKLDSADAEMSRIKDFWTAIGRALTLVPTSVAVETRLTALRQIAEIADADGLARVQYGDGTIEEMSIHRAVAIAALEQLTGTP